ncbi:DUF3365 domain-containing protein [Exilibacterium tricleocarpae]|uniref:DUF3365 domain-containing protein n=1 Tax=Exilibacterium tricleocarpae TaxID=2591008 RepID=A0A545SPN2_9GAMM|nr:DUF3365 domain-containing protein [Exilibacterium tricleocarpae]TQV66921.1 DUF3365 domain-containing protein [Exilibacterium tricleocarpae]
MRFVVFLILAMANAQADINVDLLSKEARQQVSHFAAELKTTLQTGMASGGPVPAVKLCQLEAPKIAARRGDGGWQVGRTSLKTRNPDNAPDAWELATLKLFEQRKAAGENIATLEATRMTDTEFRYMKAIPTGGLCVACHGETLSTPVVEVLNRLYPQDRARGFKKGDIRGAFTLSKPVAVAK